MGLFYKSGSGTSNNSLLPFVTFSARFGTFWEHFVASGGHAHSRFDAESNIGCDFRGPYKTHAANRRAHYQAVDIRELIGRT